MRLEPIISLHPVDTISAIRPSLSAAAAAPQYEKRGSRDRIGLPSKKARSERALMQAHAAPG
jgi:hypothetical protein